MPNTASATSIRIGSLRRRLNMRRGSLSASDRDAPANPLRLGASILSTLEDAPQPTQCTLVLALHPAKASQTLHDLVRARHRHGLRREAHPRGPGSRRVELVHPKRTDAVVLAHSPNLHDPVGALDLDERNVAPAGAVAGRLHTKARAGAQTDRVDP